MILLIGANGSMGRRYQAILKYLGHDYMAVDTETRGDDLDAKAAIASGIILCTPTDTHYKILKQLAPLNKFTLCEKPISKNLDELREIFDLYQNARLKMVMQYELFDSGRFGKSIYNYYNHGKDGLVWDCMQVIALARGEWEIDETSPVWSCWLNGQRLNLSDMDNAYIETIRKWFMEPRGEMLRLYDIHAKVAEAAKRHVQ